MWYRKFLLVVVNRLNVILKPLGGSHEEDLHGKCRTGKEK
jgi:hypothetical protein